MTEMKNLIFFAVSFIFLISYSYGESEPSASVIEGEDFEFSFEGVEKAIGVKRLLLGRGAPEGWQFYYLCEKSKGDNKKKCGKWVDEKGNKVNNGNKVTVKGIHAIISNISVEDGGRYTAIVEDSKDEVNGLRLYVGPKPPPPPKY